MRPFHHQELPEIFSHVPGTTSPRHSVSPPAAVPNKPAPWQLGRHSHYTYSTEYDQLSPRLSVQPIVGSVQGDSDAKWNTEDQHQMNKTDEEGIRNVEEELHRGLKARQVRLLRF